MQFLIHRHQRLIKVLQSLHHPRSCSVIVDGEQLGLPLRLPFRDPASIQKGIQDRMTLEKLAYAFSVYGRVTPYTSSGGFSLSVTTRLSRASVPVGFAKEFGGTVYLDRGGKGATLPNVTWTVHSDRAIHLAQFLNSLPFKSRKHGMLAVGANWPKDKTEKVFAAERLRELRRNQRRNFCENGKIQTWRDLTELFDFRGHVICVGTKGIRLTISHPNVGLLASISEFLEKEGLLTRLSIRGVYSYGPTNTNWSFQRKTVVTVMLTKMLEQGLAFQRLKALLALKALKGEETSERIFQFKALLDPTNSGKKRRVFGQENKLKNILKALNNQLAYWQALRGDVVRFYGRRLKFEEMMKIQIALRRLQRSTRKEVSLRGTRRDIRILLRRIKDQKY